MPDETLMGGANNSTDSAEPEETTAAEPTGEETTETTTEPIQYDFTELAGEHYDEARANEFSELLRAANVPTEQANEIAKYGIQYAQDAVAALQQQRAEEVQEWGKQTKETLGKEFDSTLQRCGIAVERLEKDIPNIRTVLNETGIGNRVEVVKAFALLGELLSEDSGHGTTSGAAKQASIYSNTDFSKY